MPERAWTQAELAEMERLKLRAGYTGPMIAAALDRSLHSVKARWKRWRQGRREGKRPATPRPRRPGRPPHPYHALERALAEGRAHPAVLALFREIVDRRLEEERLCRRAGIAVTCLRQWARRKNPSLHNLASALEVVGLRLTTERIDEDHGRAGPGHGPRPLPGADGGCGRGRRTEVRRDVLPPPADHHRAVPRTAGQAAEGHPSPT